MDINLEEKFNKIKQDVLQIEQRIVALQNELETLKVQRDQGIGKLFMLQELANEGIKNEKS